MKKNIFNNLWLLSLVAVGCQNVAEIADPTANSESDTSLITITASTSADTKVSFTETTDAIKLAWEDGDSFAVYNANDELVSTFKYSGVAGATSGTFTQESSDAVMTTGEYTAVIGKDYTTDNQVIENIESLDHLKNYVRLSCDFTYTEGESTSIAFLHELSLIKLNIAATGGIIPACIALTDGDNNYSLTLPEGVGQSFSAYMAVETNDVDAARDLEFVVTDTKGARHECVKNSSKDFVAGEFYSSTINVDIDYYEEGYTTPDGAAYSKDTENAQLITADTQISKSGVYFVEPGVTVSLSAATYNNLVIIGRNSHDKATVNCNGRISFDNGEGVVWKNINVITKYNNYLVDAAGDNKIVNRWIVEDCYVETYPSKPLTAFTKSYCAVKNISMQNNIFKCPVTANNQAIRIVNFNKTLNSDLSNYESFTFVNNIVYTPTFFAGGSVLMMNDTSTGISALNYKITVSNNTFVNFLGSPDTALLVLQNGNITANNNLMWASSNISYHSTMFLFKNGNIPSTGPISMTYDGNIFYGLNIESHNWQIYHSKNSKYGYVAGHNLFSRLSSDPLSTCDLENEIFIKDATYESKGATIVK